MKRRDDKPDVTVGQTPEPRDHVTPRVPAKDWSGVRDGDVIGGHTFGAPLTGKRGDEVVGSARMYLKTAEEHAGKAGVALDFAIDAALRDVVLAGAVPVLHELRGTLHTIEQRIASMRAERAGK